MTDETGRCGQLITAARGEGFRNADGSDRQLVIAALRSGDAVELRRERDNRRDAQAVALFSSGGAQIGYLSRDVARIVAPLMDAGRPVTAVVERTQRRTRPDSLRIALLRLDLTPRPAQD